MTVVPFTLSVASRHLSQRERQGTCANFKQSDKSKFKRLGPLLRRGPSRLRILSLGENLIRVQDEGNRAVILAVDLHIRSEFSVLWWEAPLLTFP